MGSLALPKSGTIYVDTQTIIYTVEQHPTYAALCRPMWQLSQITLTPVMTSDLALTEVLVRPIRDSDTGLQSRFEQFLLASDTSSLPITRDILREAARLRATISSLRTPDAIHAATTLVHGCSVFVTNDAGLKRIPGLKVEILDEVLKS